MSRDRKAYFDATRRGLVMAVPVLSVLLLGGCGFQPVYARKEAGSAGAVEQLARIKIRTFDNREGQILHNLLLDRFNPYGRPTDPDYVLSGDVSVSSTRSGTQLDATTVRGQVTVSSTVILGIKGEENQEFRSQAVASFSVSVSDYATEVAEDGAVERTLRVIADDLRLQIVTYFEKRRLTHGA
ncbi:hypothetical protein HH303_11035 [Rhodospirillaceae bacterium KN72]|uniref:LPS-assembly lipoprotein n=1 Tax=Pacificispira spongiicola TaxID=2729598 RepID=A0A7Y0E0M7_9PROT|nr:LPS assembly lipoprotein LptE [Pacificispira spongiicola]NMM45014.1 hypothetical protein [Pacificispira spongiicola]